MDEKHSESSDESESISPKTKKEGDESPETMKVPACSALQNLGHKSISYPDAESVTTAISLNRIGEAYYKNMESSDTGNLYRRNEDKNFNTLLGTSKEGQKLREREYVCKFIEQGSGYRDKKCLPNRSPESSGSSICPNSSDHTGSQQSEGSDNATEKSVGDIKRCHKKYNPPRQRRSVRRHRAKESSEHSSKGSKTGSYKITFFKSTEIRSPDSEQSEPGANLSMKSDNLCEYICGKESLSSRDTKKNTHVPSNSQIPEILGLDNFDSMKLQLDQIIEEKTERSQSDIDSLIVNPSDTRDSLDDMINDVDKNKPSYKRLWSDILSDDEDSNPSNTDDRCLETGNTIDRKRTKAKPTYKSSLPALKKIRHDSTSQFIKKEASTLEQSRNNLLDKGHSLPNMHIKRISDAKYELHYCNKSISVKRKAAFSDEGLPEDSSSNESFSSSSSDFAGDSSSDESDECFFKIL